MARPDRDLLRHPRSPLARPAGRAGPSCGTRRDCGRRGPKRPKLSQGAHHSAENTSERSCSVSQPPGTAARASSDRSERATLQEYAMRPLKHSHRPVLKIRVCFLFFLFFCRYHAHHGGSMPSESALTGTAKQLSKPHHTLPPCTRRAAHDVQAMQPAGRADERGHPERGRPCAVPPRTRAQHSRTACRGGQGAREHERQERGPAPRAHPARAGAGQQRRDQRGRPVQARRGGQPGTQRGQQHRRVPAPQHRAARCPAAAGRRAACASERRSSHSRSCGQRSRRRGRSCLRGA